MTARTGKRLLAGVLHWKGRAAACFRTQAAPNQTHAREGGARMAVKQSITERFWPKVDVREPHECWTWKASADSQGYGRLGSAYGRTPAMAHRLAYELVVGPISEGLEIDHLCRNPSCVNPAHLEPVTRNENMRRRRKAFCARGHAMVDSNLRPGPKRKCAACAKYRDRLRYAPAVRQMGP